MIETKPQRSEATVHDPICGMTIDPAQAFAPLKNGPGSPKDSPESVRAQMVAFYRRWLQGAGAIVVDGVQVELSPLFALDQAELGEKIRPGTPITGDTYFV